MGACHDDEIEGGEREVKKRSSVKSVEYGQCQAPDKKFRRVRLQLLPFRRLVWEKLYPPQMEWRECAAFREEKYHDFHSDFDAISIDFMSMSFDF